MLTAAAVYSTLQATNGESAEPEIKAIQDVNPPGPKAIGVAEALGVPVDLSGQAS